MGLKRGERVCLALDLTCDLLCTKGEEEEWEERRQPDITMYNVHTSTSPSIADSAFPSPPLLMRCVVICERVAMNV